MLRHLLALSVLIAVSIASGCMTSPKSDSDLPPASGRGMGNSTPGTPSSEDEQWSKIGRQMRGDAPAQQSWDPLHDLMASPKAQSIERSLGVDN
jgi:hypothetical protein